MHKFEHHDMFCRMDEYALVGTPSESTSKSVSLDGARRMALKHIEAFVLMFSDPQAFAAAAASSAPAALAQVTEGARIQEAGHLRCRFPFLLISCKSCPFLVLLYLTTSCMVLFSDDTKPLSAACFSGILCFGIKILCCTTAYNFKFLTFFFIYRHSFSLYI